MLPLFDIKQTENIKKWLDRFLILLSVSAVFSLLMILGYHLSEFWFDFMVYATDAIVVMFAAQEIFRWFLVKDHKRYLRERWIENSFTLLIILGTIFPQEIFFFFEFLFPEFDPKKITILYLATFELSVLAVAIVKVLRYNHLISRIKLHPGSLFALSFLKVIILGTILLSLPKATLPGHSISFTDALFTSTSAVCVTGLSTIVVPETLSTFGKGVLFFLIQVGGLGVMTLTTFFAALFAGGLSFRFRIMMRDMLSQDNISQVWSLLSKIIIFTAIFEIGGALFLYWSLGGTFTAFDRTLFYDCIFHSVSAFCNAGFSLYPEGFMQPNIASNYSYLSTIMVLIVAGGLGFAVFANFINQEPWSSRTHRNSLRMTMQSKLVLITTLILIVAGTILFYLSDSNGSIANMSTFDKIFQATFWSVTARTAGFNAVDTSSLAPAALMIMIILMWIGASPGSTGGGIKTSTIGVTFLALINQIRGNEKIRIFKRELAPESVKRAFLVVISSLLALGIASTALVWAEPGKNTMDLIFETTSAISTVGLSRGITPDLTVIGKYIIILLMFIGRIGVLAFLMSFHNPGTSPNYNLPTENIIVG